METDPLDLYLKPQPTQSDVAAPTSVAPSAETDPLDIYLKPRSQEKPPQRKFGLGDTWPARLAKAIGAAVMVPGQAYQATADNPATIENMIEPAFGLAGLIGTGGIPSVLSKSATKPLLDPETARLMDIARNEYDIPIRGSQMLPSMKRTDLVASNKPFTGFGENTAAQQEGFNRTLNKIVFGVDQPKVSKEIVDQFKTNYGTVVDDVTDRVGKIKFDEAAHNDLLDTFRQASINMPDKIQIIQKKIGEIAKNVDNNGEMSAKTYRGLMRKGGLLDPSIYTDGVVEHHVEMLRKDFKNVLARNASPEDVALLKKWDTRYAMMKDVKPLIENSVSGDVNPASLLKAVPSFSHLSDLAKIGQIMKPASSSGTAENLSAMQKWGLSSLAGGAELGLIWHDPMLAAKLTGATIGLAGSRAAFNAGRGAYLRSNYLADKLINSGLPHQVQPMSPLQKLLNGTAAPYTLPAVSQPQLLPPITVSQP